MKNLVLILAVILTNILCVNAQTIINGHSLSVPEDLPPIYVDSIESYNQQIKINDRALYLVFSTGETHLVGANHGFQVDLDIEISPRDFNDEEIEPSKMIRLSISNIKPEQYYIYKFKNLFFINHFNISYSNLTFNIMPNSDDETSSIDEEFLKNYIQLKIYTQDDLGFGIFDKNYEKITPQNLRVEPCSECNSDNVSFVTFFWHLPDTTQYFESYDLELLKVEPFDDGSVDINWNLASRLEVFDTVYSMTLAEGTGFYLWRVRGIGSFYPGGRSNKNNFGNWSEFLDDHNHELYNDDEAIPNNTDLIINNFIDATLTSNYFYYYQFNDSINWIYNKVLSEKSRQSETITFANGLNQVKQIQTKLFSTNSVLATQNVYDYAGRPSLQTLIAPIGDNKLGYKNDFFYNNDNIPYNAADFDNNSNRYEPVSVISSTTTPESPWKYYSQYNIQGTKAEYIAEANGYPFVRTVYYPDPTGRIYMQSGPGNVMRIMSGPDAKNIIYSYATANQTELDRMFGIEAPLAENVYKQTVIDPNKVATVSYFSYDGKLLATCLNDAIETPALFDVGNEEKKLDTLRLDRGDFYETGGTLLFSNNNRLDITEDSKTVYFQYKIRPSVFAFNCPNDENQNFCYTCDYKVEIELVYPLAPNAIGRNLKISFNLSPQEITDCSEQPFLTFSDIGDITFSEPAGDDDDDLPPFLPIEINSGENNFSLSLSRGTYLIEKRIYMNNPLFEEDPDYNGNPALNITYLEKYEQMVNSLADGWTIENNCCGEYEPDAILIDCDDKSEYCSTDGTGFKDESSYNDFLNLMLTTLDNEREATYKSKLLNRGEDLKGKEYKTLSRLDEYLKPIIIDNNLTCEDIVECYHSAAGQLEANIILSNQEYSSSGDEITTVDDAVDPGELMPSESDDEPQYMHDEKFDFLKAFENCLGVKESHDCDSDHYTGIAVYYRETPEEEFEIPEGDPRKYVEILPPELDLPGVTTEEDLSPKQKKYADEAQKNENCLRPYFELVFNLETENVDVIDFYHDYNETSEDAIIDVCDCIQQSNQEEPEEDGERIECTLSEIVTKCEERCENKRDDFRNSIIEYVNDRGISQTVEDYFAGFSLECLVDIMVQQCKSRCGDITDNQIDLEALIDDEELQEYIQSEEFINFAERNTNSYCEAILQNTSVAPVGDYLLEPTLEQIHEEIIDSVYFSLKKSIIYRKKTAKFNNTPPVIPITRYFDTGNPGTTVPYNEDKLVYRQDSFSFIYPVLQSDESFNYFKLDVVVNAVWDEAADTISRFKIADDLFLQYDISFYCGTSQIAHFAHFAYVDQTTDEPVYLNDLYQTLNQPLPGVENILKIYFDDLEFLHIIPDKYNLTGITDKNNITGLSYSGISPFEILHYFTFNITSAVRNSSLELSVNEVTDVFTLIKAPGITYTPEIPDIESFKQAIIKTINGDEINKGLRKYWATSGDPITGDYSNEIFIALRAKWTDVDPSTYSLNITSIGSIMIENVRSQNYIPITPLHSLITECEITELEQRAECPYGYFKVVGDIDISGEIEDDDYQLNGDAEELPSGDGFIITPDSMMQRGSIWHKEKIDLDEPFEKEFIIYLGEKDNDGGEGIAFVLQNDPSGTDALGYYSNYLGYSEYDASDRIKPSFAIEIDTKNDASDFNGMTNPPVKDRDHISVIIDANITENSIILPVSASADAENIEDDTEHTLKIVWSGIESERLKVYLDRELRVNIRKKLKDDIFEDEKYVYWGFTGATGLTGTTPCVSNLQWFKPLGECPDCELPCEICMRWDPLIYPEDIIPPLTSDYPPYEVYECEDIRQEYIDDQSDYYLQECRAQSLDLLRENYRTGILNVQDALVISDTSGCHHYTLYYYDRAGNLVKTIPPEGVRLLTKDEMVEVRLFRAGSGAGILPDHRLATTYHYNSVKQLVKQYTPDSDTTRYWYNAFGQQVLSQDAVQRANDRYAYIKYDELGQVVESGILTGFNPTFRMNTDNQEIDELWENRSFPDMTMSGKSEVVKNIYSDISSVEYEPGITQRFLRNRISYSIRDEDGDFTTLNDQSGIYYSYDPHGNVEWMIHEIPEIGQKKIRYEYDLISGNVNKLYYQENTPEQFIHQYEYDEDNRIVKVFTSTDGIIWDRDAQYEYYLHGPLSRLEIGEDKIQGVDYVYSIEGYLKSINQVDLDPDRDPGRDGQNVDGYLADEFAMELGYYPSDYTRSGTFINDNNPFSTNDFNPDFGLYNGNISYWTSNSRSGDMEDLVENPIGMKTNLYKYDKLNRLREVDFRKWSAANRFRETDQSYDEQFTYDANGNISTVSRYGWHGSGRPADYKIDELTYHYNLNKNNQLLYIHDEIGQIDDDLPDQDEDNYTYDAEGKLTSDVSEGLNISWNNLDKIDTVINTNTEKKITFQYNPLGHRISKKVSDIREGPDAAPDITTYYINDINGKILAIYKKVTDELPTLSEVPIYGTERIGLYKPDLEVIEHDESELPEPVFQKSTELSHWLISTGPDENGESGTHLSFFNNVVDVLPGCATERLDDKDLYMGYNVSSAQDENQQKVFEFFVTNDDEIPVWESGLRAEYFDNFSLSGEPSVHFGSVRWSGKIKIPVTGKYQFILVTTGTVRLYIDGDLWINNDDIEYEPWVDPYSPPFYNFFYQDFSSKGKKLSEGLHDIIVECESIGLGYYIYWQKNTFLWFWTSPKIVPKEWFGYIAVDESRLVDSKGDLIEHGEEIKATRNTRSITIKTPGEDNDKYYLVTGKDDILYCHTIHASPYYAELTEINHAIPNIELFDIPHPYALAVYNDLTNPALNRLFVAVNEIKNIKIHEFMINEEGLEELGEPKTIPVDIETDTLDIGEMQISPDGSKLALSYSKEVADKYKHYLALYSLDATSSEMLSETWDDILLIDEELNGIVRGKNQKLRKRVMSFDFSPEGNYVYFLHQNCDASTLIDSCYIEIMKPVTIKRIDLNQEDPETQDVYQGSVLRYEGTIRRGKDKKLYTNAQLARPPTEKLLSFANLEAEYVTEIIRGELLHDKGLNHFGIPLQPYRIDPVEIIPDDTLFAERIVGKKQYELTDHLRNTRAVITDERNTTIDENGIIAQSQPKISSLSDYYAFGAMIPGRNVIDDTYRFGFQGQEVDKDIMGNGLLINYRHRNYNPEICRFFTSDPLESKFPWNTPYAFSENRVINRIEFEGLESRQFELSARGQWNVDIFSVGLEVLGIGLKYQEKEFQRKTTTLEIPNFYVRKPVYEGGTKKSFTLAILSGSEEKYSGPGGRKTTRQQVCITVFCGSRSKNKEDVVTDYRYEVKFSSSVGILTIGTGAQVVFKGKLDVIKETLQTSIRGEANVFIPIDAEGLPSPVSGIGAEGRLELAGPPIEDVIPKDIETIPAK